MNVHAACEDDRLAPEKQPAPDVSVVVVSYNTKDYTLACLESLLDQTESASMQAIVLDNASSDGSADAIAERFCDIELIRSPDNLGVGPTTRTGHSLPDKAAPRQSVHPTT